jgi:hypothetical protein
VSVVQLKEVSCLSFTASGTEETVRVGSMRQFLYRTDAPVTAKQSKLRDNGPRDLLRTQPMMRPS